MVFPNINPIAFQLGPLQVHWYGLMYLFGFLIAWGLAVWRAQKPGSAWTKDQVSDLIFYCAFGVIIGGRIGYMLIYDFSGLMQDPIRLFKIWEGGMSFHGGFLGVAIALWIYHLRTAKNFFAITDFVAPFVPIGLGAGRIGNFINGELWGRPTDLPWGMIYPHAGMIPRHPSELYEFLLEGVLLFLILWFYSAKPRPCMAVTGLFVGLYGVFRSFAEFFRQPDLQMGFVAWHWLTMGQLLSFPMIFIGFGMLWYAYCFKRKVVKT